MSQVISFQIPVTPGSFVAGITGNTGGEVFPDGTGNLNLVGTGSVTVTGNPGTNTLTISDSGISSISITGDSGGAQSGSAFTFTASGIGLSFAGAADAFTLGGTLTVPHGGTGDTSFTAYAPIVGGTTSTGVLQSAATGMGTAGNVFTSNGSAALPTWQPSSGGGGGITTIDGDSGSVTGSTVTFTGGTSGAVFTGSGATMTESFNFLALPTTTSTNGQITINSIPFFHGYGANNVFAGPNAGNFTFNTTNGIFNTGVGSNALAGLTASSNGSFNTAIGADNLSGCTTGFNNSSFGFITMNSLTTGSENIGFGFNSLRFLLSGSNNIAIGTGAGNNLTSSESNCVNIGDAGVTGVSGFLAISIPGQGTATIHNYNSQSGADNLFLGVGSGNRTMTGSGAVNNYGFGFETLKSITTGGGNVAIGNLAGQAITSGNGNFCIGYEANFSMATGSNNVAIGIQPNLFGTSGSFNTVIGANQPANAYAGSESSNINIGNPGVAGDNNTIRIGNQGSGNAQQNTAFIAGVAGVTVANQNFVTINTATGQLGSTAGGGGGGGITTINGDSGSVTGSTVTFNANSQAGSSVKFVGSGTTMSFDVTDGNTNTLIGSSAGNATLTGSLNTGLGNDALNALTSGVENVAIGASAGRLITAGTTNVAVGYLALPNITSGSNNVGIGTSAGNNYSSAETSNICINSLGVTSESNTLRIGSGTGISSGNLNQAFISGITGITVTGTAVLISTGNQLGVAVSSARFKDNIADMDSASSDLLKLRPVTFNYTVGEDRSTQTGLIAEEVAEIMPSLVVYDQGGLPQTVKYHDLPAMLLNELQKAIKRIEVLEAQLGVK